MKHKYVRHSILGFIVWPTTDNLYHSYVGEVLLRNCLGTILSAGFAYIEDGHVRCSGHSESLRIRSIPGDSEALARQLSLKVAKF